MLILLLLQRCCYVVTTLSTEHEEGQGGVLEEFGLWLLVSEKTCTHVDREIVGGLVVAAVGHILPY